MVTIPSPQQQGAPVGSVEVQPANTPFINVSPADTSQPGRDMQALGNSLQQLALNLNQQRNENGLREAQQELFTLEQELFDPRNGIQTKLNGNAAGVSEVVQERIGALRGSIQERYNGKVSGSGMQAINDMLDSAERRLWSKAASHETAQLQANQTNLLNAGVEAQADRAARFWNDPVELQASYTFTMGLAEDLADNAGYTDDTPEGRLAREQFIQEVSSKWALQAAFGMLQQSPAAAERFVKQQMESGALDATEGAAFLAQYNTAIVTDKAKAELAIANGQSPQWTVADPIKGTPPATFRERLIMRESSGNAAARSPMDSEGRIHYGLGQFSERRFQDLKNAGVVPAGMSIQEFASEENADLQRKAIDWAIADIDAFIDANMLHDKGWSRDGLRAVAWLGGKEGMLRWVKSGGKADPNDLFGTSLTQYYNEFSGQGKPGKTYEKPEDYVATIEDPNVRAKAYELLEEQYAAEAKRTKREKEQVVDKLYATMEQYITAGQADEFPIDQLMIQYAPILGKDVEGVRNFWTKRLKGEDVVTPPATLDTLENLAASDQIAFAAVDLTNLRLTGRLSEDDFKRFTKLQAAEKAKLNSGMPYGVNEISSMTASVARRYELDTKAKGTLEMQVADFVTAFTTREGRFPSPTEVIQYADSISQKNQLSVINPPGWWDAKKGSISEVIAKADAEGLSVLYESDLTLQVPQRDGSVRQVKITPERMREIVAQFTGVDAGNKFDIDIGMNMTPTPSELIAYAIILESDILP